ncbi:MAG: phosphohydrolase [Coriobacteriia bacterium]|nr:phosphohydrolase [Coriobacteriia bacterium]
MPVAGCPGQDARALTAEDVACPVCGYAVEFFSDERSRKCQSCGQKVMRDRGDNCADWCSAAADCAILRGMRPDSE